uniref:Uncharacterized protein n=1 Tax=Helianthus annuus TaxID=4232 RepID=A0A251VP05_HELAN
MKVQQHGPRPGCAVDMSRNGRIDFLTNSASVPVIQFRMTYLMQLKSSNFTRGG